MFVLIRNCQTVCQTDYAHHQSSYMISSSLSSNLHWKKDLGISPFSTLLTLSVVDCKHKSFEQSGQFFRARLVYDTMCCEAYMCTHTTRVHTLSICMCCECSLQDYKWGEKIKITLVYENYFLCFLE